MIPWIGIDEERYATLEQRTHHGPLWQMTDGGRHSVWMIAGALGRGDMIE